MYALHIHVHVCFPPPLGISLEHPCTVHTNTYMSELRSVSCKVCHHHPSFPMPTACCSAKLFDCVNDIYMLTFVTWNKV